VREDDVATLETSTALLVFRHFRGRGYAAEIARLALGEDVLASAESVVGAVEQDNVASWRAATAAGFTETGADDDGLVLWTRKMVASEQRAVPKKHRRIYQGRVPSASK
jgi:RimJ/RimL family protein N-acetyltransferase